MWQTHLDIQIMWHSDLNIYAAEEINMLWIIPLQTVSGGHEERAAYLVMLSHNQIIECNN